MDRILKRLTLTVALAGVAAFPAQAQTGWGALGIHGGWLAPADVADGPQGRLALGDAPVLGGSADFWFGENRRWGLGLEGSWTRWSDWNPTFAASFGERMDVYTYDASLIWRFTRPTFESRFLPYLTAGLGAITINPREGLDYAPADVRLSSATRTQLAAAVGIGTDWFVTPDVAVRLQVKDYWTDRSPYRRLSDNTFHSGGHNIQVNGGLAFYFGRMRVEEPGFVREEPIVVEPEPTPPPPAEETVMVCVIERTDYRVREIEAISVPAEDRVYVMRDGQRVRLETAYPATAPVYVRGATWYMADRPLVVDLEAPVGVDPADRSRLELVLFGTPAQRSPADLVFVGTIEGTPIYATRNDVAAFRPRLDAQLATSRDLGTILRADPELAREFAAVSTYYVAVEPECVFRPVSVTHFVRRTRG